MYIKRVTKRNKKSKKTYEYLHLVENIRTARGPRQRLVLNLGSLDIDPDQYKSLANAIECMMSGQRHLFDLDPGLKKIAAGAIRRLQRKNEKPVARNAGSPKRDVREIDANSMDASESRSIGPEYVCHHFYQQLRFDDILADAGVNADMRAVIEAVIIGRLVDPGSERHTFHWANNRTALFELIRPPRRRSFSSFYRAGDILLRCKKTLESRLAEEARTLFSLSETMCFFDLTNTYFEGSAGGNPKAGFGKSKEKRADCKLLTLAMIVDQEGFSKCSRLYPGNQYEGHTLKEMITDLASVAPALPDSRTIVIDAGIANEENIAWLKEKHYHYVVVNRSRDMFCEKDARDMSVIRDDKNLKVEVKRAKKDNEAFLLCRSSGRDLKDQGIQTRQESAFLKRLLEIRNGLNRKRCTKKYAKILEMIGRLRQKYPRASKMYDINVAPESSPASPRLMKAVDISWKKTQKYLDGNTLESCYVLRTDRLDLSDQEIWNIHAMLARIESAFRSLKASLGLRPVFHQTEDRSDAHLFISTLAYHILHAIEKRLLENGDHRFWETVRDDLSTHQRITLEFDQKKKNGSFERQYFRTCTRPEPIHEEIYDRLGLDGRPLPRMACSGFKV